jgi:hypothetical protein
VVGEVAPKMPRNRDAPTTRVGLRRASQKLPADVHDPLPHLDPAPESVDIGATEPSQLPEPKAAPE